eukprot:8621481-Karenia_brevis.AAC.1
MVMTNEGDASFVGFKGNAFKAALGAPCNERSGSLCRGLLTLGEWPVSRGGIEMRRDLLPLPLNSWSAEDWNGAAGK